MWATLVAAGVCCCRGSAACKLFVRARSRGPVLLGVWQGGSGVALFGCLQCVELLSMEMRSGWYAA